MRMEITLYGYDNCVKCSEAEIALKASGASVRHVDADDIHSDIGGDPDVASEIIAKAHGELPLIRIGNDVFARVGSIA